MKITCLLFDPSETSYAVNTALNVIMLLGLLRSEKMTPLLPTVLWQGRFGKIRSENPGLAPHTHPRVSRRHKVAAAVKFCATLGQQKRDTNSPCPSVGRNNNFSVSLQFNSLSWWNGHANQSLAALHSSQLPSQQTWETEPQGQSCTRLWLFTLPDPRVSVAMLLESTGLSWKEQLCSLNKYGAAATGRHGLFLKGSFYWVAIKTIFLLKQTWDKM